MGTRVPLDPEEVRRREMSEKLSLSLAEIGLSVRTTNCLDEQGISTVADLLKCRRQTLLNIPNFGLFPMTWRMAPFTPLAWFSGVIGYPSPYAALTEL